MPKTLIIAIAPPSISEGDICYHVFDKAKISQIRYLTVEELRDLDNEFGSKLDPDDTYMVIENPIDAGGTVITTYIELEISNDTPYKIIHR